MLPHDAMWQGVASICDRFEAVSADHVFVQVVLVAAVAAEADDGVARAEQRFAAALAWPGREGQALAFVIDVEPHVVAGFEIVYVVGLHRFDPLRRGRSRPTQRAEYVICLHMMPDVFGATCCQAPDRARSRTRLRGPELPIRQAWSPAGSGPELHELADLATRLISSPLCLPTLLEKDD
jgi:hypothetical protein